VSSVLARSRDFSRCLVRLEDRVVWTRSPILRFQRSAQEEIDYFWEKLAADGGEPNVCGWLRDKFGMPWQIVPSQIWDWLNGDDPAMVQRVTSKVWAMEKLDMAELQRAANGKAGPG
jgi:predicted 3-demethylubiquinone-9 3-methyltransferase (glyoxalase superfamily)